MKAVPLHRIAGYVLAASAVVACPCHLVLLLPLLLAVLSGTAFGGVLAQNPGILVGAATLYFLAALAGAYKLLTAKADAHGAGEQPDREPCCPPIARGAQHTYD